MAVDYGEVYVYNLADLEVVLDLPRRIIKRWINSGELQTRPRKKPNSPYEITDRALLKFACVDSSESRKYRRIILLSSANPVIRRMEDRNWYWRYNLYFKIKEPIEWGLTTYYPNKTLLWSFEDLKTAKEYCIKLNAYNKWPKDKTEYYIRDEYIQTETATHFTHLFLAAHEI